MIVVDTSALMAVLLDGPDATRCITAMAGEPRLAISAGTLAEAMIVAGRRGAGMALGQLVARLKPEVFPVTAGDARLVGEAYGKWGKGVHPAGLNFGDCFAYALAKATGGGLLFVGEDFSKTDVVAA